MRSFWTLGVLLVLLGSYGGALNLPWYTYSHSTGRTLPPEFPGNETGENLTRRFYYPFELRGDVNQTQAAQARPLVSNLGLGLVLALSITGVAFAIELFWGHLDWARWPGLALTLLGLGLTALVLAYVWFAIPPTLAQEGARGVFTNRQTSDGYVRTTLGWGWLVGGLTVLGHLTHFAFRYQQGSFDLSFIERFRRRA